MSTLFDGYVYGLGKLCLTFQGVIAGLLVQNTLKFLLGFGHVSPYLVSTAQVFEHHLFSFSLSIANYTFLFCSKDCEIYSLKGKPMRPP